MHVILSHGRGLNAQSKDMVYLARRAEALGHSSERINEPDCDDPRERRQKLSEHLAACAAPELILVGFSLGGYASLMAAAEHRQRVRGLFLIAPALYIPHYPQEDYPILPHTYLIQGWRDRLVPPSHALRYAEYAGAQLQLLPAGHLFKSPQELHWLCEGFEHMLRSFQLQ